MPLADFDLDPGRASVLNFDKISISYDSPALKPISCNSYDAPLLTPPVPHSITELDEVLLRLREGGVVAIPTDTLYGLAADIGNMGALGLIFDIKGRPADLALPVLVGSWDQVGMVALAEDCGVHRIAAEFWPGSLTLVLPRAPSLSDLITGGRETVAVRMPSHWIPLNLAIGLGRPITGTSANRSGQANLNSPDEIRKVLGDSLSDVVSLGPAPGGLQSTIVDMTGDCPVLLREGATPFAEVFRVWQQDNITGAEEAAGGA